MFVETFERSLEVELLTTMGNDFHTIAFTPAVKAEQTVRGSRNAYANQDAKAERAGCHERFGDDERAFIAARDSFYVASVGETGWPYVQHRGGPAGFLRVLDDRTLGFADFDGNRQYVSVGNLDGEGRVCLFLMDYPERTRLKIYGRVRLSEDRDIVERLSAPHYPARVERVWSIAVAGFDWNCPKHITPRYTEADIEGIVHPLRARIAELEAEIERSRMR